MGFCLKRTATLLCNLGQVTVPLWAFIMLGRIGNSPKWWWLKDKEGKSVKTEQRKAKGKSEDRSEDLR